MALFTEPSTIHDIPANDPVHTIVDSIVGLVPVSYWTFARFKADAQQDQFLTSVRVEADVRAAGFRHAAGELALQSQRVSSGPAIASVAGSIGAYASGLTLLLADNRVRFGLLTLFRTAELGPFRSADIRTLTFALDAACDDLSEARLMELEFHRLSERQLDCPVVDDIAYYILDRDLEIVLSWTTENKRRFTSASDAPATQLPPLLAQSVRGLTAGWTEDPATHEPGMAIPVPFLVLRTRPMTGRSGSFISVSVERLKPFQSLVHAAAHFRFSPRELQVLSLLLRGTSLDEIATGLMISSSTVQDHVKRLIEKTRSGNRSEMIANVFRHNTQAQ